MKITFYNLLAFNVYNIPNFVSENVHTKICCLTVACLCPMLIRQDSVDIDINALLVAIVMVLLENRRVTETTSRSI